MKFVSTRVRLWIGIGLSLLCLWLATRNIRLSEVLQVLARANYAFVFIALGLVLVVPLLRALRWRLLFYPEHRSLRWSRLLAAILIGQMANIAFPARLGDLARVYLLSQIEGPSKSLTLGTVVVEKLMEALAFSLLFLAAVGALMVPSWLVEPGMAMTGLAFSLLLAVVAFSWLRSVRPAVLDKVLRYLPERPRRWCQVHLELAMSSLDFLRERNVALQVMGWSLIILLIGAGINYVTFFAVGLFLPFSTALLLLFILQLGIAVPSSPGKVGVFHYLTVLGLSLFAVERGLALAYSVLLYFIVFLPPSLLGAFFLWWESLNGRPGPSSERMARAGCTSAQDRLEMDQNRIGSPQSLVKISVVVPAYNAAATLGDCLEALLTQTVSGTEYEVIVVDDGSTDGTAEVTKALVDSRVTLLSQPNGGAAAAKNLGVRHARGEVILFTDADCVPRPDWIEAMRIAFADPEIVGVKGICQTRQQGLIPRFTQIEYEDKYDMMARHRYIDFVDTASAGYRKRVLVENGGFDPTLRTVEDVELSFRLSRQGYKMVFAPQAVVYHRHPETLGAYARRKLAYGFWRTRIYQRYPQKVIKDSRTPQTQKIQVVLFCLLTAALIGSPFFPGLLLATALFLFLFLISTLPFVSKALRKDRLVGVLSPLLLLVRAAAIGVGLVAGVVRRTLEVWR